MGPCTWHTEDHLASKGGREEERGRGGEREEEERGRGEGEERRRKGGGVEEGRGTRERDRREEKGDGLQLFTHNRWYGWPHPPCYVRVPSLHIYHTTGGMGGHTHHVT